MYNEVMAAVKLVILFVVFFFLFWGGRAAAQVRQYSAQVQERFNDIMDEARPAPPATPEMKTLPASSPEARKPIWTRRRIFFIPRRLIRMLTNRIDRKSKFIPRLPEGKPAPYSSQLRSVLEKFLFKNPR